jgi:DNA-directed RNA polymerase specialized sigma subunit
VSAYIPEQEHFKVFAAELEKLIERYGTIENWNQHQKDQVEQLIALEKKWREAVVKHGHGAWAYKRFVTFISEEKKNILAARPYFRERQEVFAKQISKVLKKGRESVEDLYKFAINYQFILFVMKQRNWGASTQITKLANDIGKLRKDIVAINLPLGIARARVFYSRTPKSHLSYMDEIQIAAEGMMSGVDKYSPGPRGRVSPKVFRSTMIGRMVGNFIEEYSDTLVHFYPVDKRKIYRANKLIRNFTNGVDYEKLAQQVNAGIKKEKAKRKAEGEETTHQTTASEISDLMAAASTVSADSSLPTDPDAPVPITRFAAPESVRPDVQVESRNAMALMKKAGMSLTLWETKLLRLKGVRLDEL